MSGAYPLHYLPWLISRASGVIALALVSMSALLGLAMATGILRRPGLKRKAARLHEHLALCALGAIALHGLALLGDGWLRPGLRGIAVPFALHYRPIYTGLGIIAGYLAVLLGPSFYLRRRIRPARWRKLHRLTIAIWFLAALHTVGAGSDATRPWLRLIVVMPIAPILYLFISRLLNSPRPARFPRPVRSGGEERPRDPRALGRPLATPLPSAP